jgi:hypothetical protein
MIGRRLLAIGAAVTGLLALVGIASRSRPFSNTEVGRGPTASFFDYVATSLVIFCLAMLAILVWALVTERGGGKPRRRGRWHLLSTLISLAVATLLATFILRTGFVDRFRTLEQKAKTGTQQPAASRSPKPSGKVREPRLRWDEIAIVVALLAGTAVVLVARSRTRRTQRPWRLGREEAVSLALDESLDDLRHDPDLRRAIVAAYARMELALAGVGLARRPAEAPFEYVSRALASLETSAAAAERLTSLFEWAKFSQHEPEPQMRDEAIDALVAVRDELRRTADAVAA